MNVGQKHFWRMIPFKSYLHQSKMKTIATIQNTPIVEETDGRVHFKADADIDCDGLGGNPQHDRYFQPDTFYHHNGKALTAETEAYIVVPPAIVRNTKGVVMGCRARVTNTLNGKVCEAVVGDLGPTKKVGELSVHAAELLGINANPNTGGEERFVILYELWPGVPAPGYSLQAAS